MAKERFCQCELRKDNKTCYGFVPEKAAKVGNTLEIEINDIMVGGWIVKSAGMPVEKSSMRMLETQHKRQRRASDQ